jgi:hypothetical protein
MIKGRLHMGMVGEKAFILQHPSISAVSGS